MGKILRLNLTERKVKIIETRDYEPWIGGHGLGSAIFWDLVKDKEISGFDARNVVTIMTSPLTGTLAVGAAARTEVQGIGIQSYPIGWFTRSNFGGRFGAMLKYAGWDGVVIEGKADRPVWVDIRDSKVLIKEADHLWGLDTWQTQEKIWQDVSGGTGFNAWVKLGGSSQTTQKPAVLTIGQAGENLSRLGALIHDAGNAAGQGGFGGVWGSKNLKAISVIGTGSIEIADPKALIEARLWAQKEYAIDLENSKDLYGFYPEVTKTSFGIGRVFSPIIFWQKPEESRPHACIGCHAGCRTRHEGGYGNESICAESGFYANYDLKRHSGIL